ncbi:MAG: LETM1 domain-containing protein [Flavobacteriaceae bacterium]|jgi:hypothetical protein|nr:LETM1 domain-containing protein [Flavobacteriaceae bacterium]
MNPSVNGWIKKYFSDKQTYQIFLDNTDTYITTRIREIGFSYGIIDTSTLPHFYQQFKLTQEELSKICFLQLLEGIYLQHNPNSTTDDFLQDVICFYEVIVPQKNGFFSSLFTETNHYIKLEKILALRWKEHFFSQSKSNDFILNMILFSIDTLTYEAYFTKKIEPTTYNSYLIEKLVEILIAFKEDNTTPNTQDLNLILFLKKIASVDNLPIENIVPSYLETNFTLDFITCNSWNNDTKELEILPLNAKQFERVNASETLLKQSELSFLKFIHKQNDEYSFFKSTNLLNNIINNSTNYIEFLLIRNKTRLVKEIQKNTQLMKLLVDSTYRDLNKEEKKMVKKQTIEVIKTIPSLAIFLLPGGTVLLPIILKFIPSLLPSSFNENTEETN